MRSEVASFLSIQQWRPLLQTRSFPGESSIHNCELHLTYTLTHRATVTRFQNSTFEARIHLPGVAAHVDVVPNENLILVTGSITPRVRTDAEGRVNTLLFCDQPCGVFGRDVPVNLAAGTEVCDDLPCIPLF